MFTAILGFHCIGLPDGGDSPLLIPPPRLLLPFPSIPLEVCLRPSFLEVISLIQLRVWKRALRAVIRDRERIYMHFHAQTHQLAAKWLFISETSTRSMYKK